METAGDTGFGTGLAFGPGGDPAIVYRNDTADEIRFAEFNGTSWQVEPVATNFGGFSNLIFDSEDRPAIAYWDESSASLVYACKEAGVWVPTTVDDEGGVGAAPSLAFTESGAPAIAYHLVKADGSNYLRFARLVGSTWSWETVLQVSEGETGRWASLAIAPDGTRGIAFQGYVNSTAEELYFASGCVDTDSDGLCDEAENDTDVFVDASMTGTDPNDPDSDDDGIVDGVEVNTYQTDPNLADTDEDGFNDLAEIQSGKDPLDESDTPDAIVEIYTAVEFLFYSESGATYQVEWSITLDEWTAFPEIITGTGDPIIRFYSTRAEPKRFFRATKLTSP